MIKNNAEWMASLRDLALRPNPPILQKGGQWRVPERKRTWQAIAPRLFDRDLERVAALAIEVLRERNPKFDLKPEDRFAASVYGKTPRFSPALRKGIAETLALMGSFSGLLTSCSLRKGEDMATAVVHAVLCNGDWIQWASVDDELPLLAEAAPRAFLEAVQASLDQKPCQFVELFAEEGRAVLSESLVSGIFWALETLAWDAEWLVKVVVLLGELATKGPNGQWVNRPFASLVDILLPWHPQTCALAPKRLAAVTTLLKEQPAVGWMLLLALLPGAVPGTSGTRKPAIRDMIPADWSDRVGPRAYHDEVSGYADLAVSEATKDRSKLVSLIHDLSRLTEAAFARALDYLGSEPVVGMAEFDRRPLWDSLLALARKHRRVSGADWALTANDVALVEEAAARLAPTAPELVYHPLFGNEDFDLYDDARDSGEVMRDLKERREKAVQEILAQGELPAVLEFARRVEAPEKVGEALGCVAPDVVDSLLPGILRTKENALLSFMRGFVWGRHSTRQWPWVDSIGVSGWTVEEKSKLLSWLPPEPETWRRAEQWLGDEVGAFWKIAVVNLGGEPKALLEAVEKLLSYGRAGKAVLCLARLVQQEVAFQSELAVRALDALTTDNFDGRAGHDVTELVMWLQRKRGIDEEVLFRIEWRLLPVLEHENRGGPKTLERRLATKPDFFCEVIRVVFRSDREERSDKQPTEAEKALAQNAYRLLHVWKTVPGTAADGSFDGGVLAKWLTDVRESAAASGHLAIALHQVGAVLLYAPADPDGLWIHRAVAEALDAKDATEMRSGFTIKRFNTRGAHFYVPGNDERSAAAIEREKADLLEEAGYHRIATAIREMAKTYDRHAELMEAHRSEADQ